MKRKPFNTGDEYDALTKAKKFLHWRPGERKKNKTFLPQKRAKMVK